MIDFKLFVKDAVNASALIAKNLQKHSADLYTKHDVGAGGDVSYGADLMAENIYVEYLAQYAQIISEESGVIGEGRYQIYLDPLDGSDNFKANIPYYGSSIALVLDEVTLVALVVNFISREVFVRDHELLYKTYLHEPTYKEEIVPTTYSSLGIVEKAYANPQGVALLHQKHLKFRSPGAVALSLASAFYVKYMLFFGTIRIYDIQAGLFLCKDMYLYKDDDMMIVARSQDIFETLCKLFHKEPY
jgi:myo-inositol-1(or 4)-monophosphatase